MKVSISVNGKFYAFDLARELEARGHLSQLITAYPAFAVKPYDIPRKKIFSVIVPEILRRIWGKLPERVKEFWDMRLSFMEMFDVLAAGKLQKSDILFCWSDSSARTMKKAKSLGAIVVTEYGSSHVLFRDKLLTEEYEKFGMQRKGMNPKILHAAMQGFKNADYIFVPSQFVERTFMEQGIPKEKLIKIPFGVNLSAFHPFPKKDDVFRVVFSGGLSLRKGTHYLLQAFSELRLSNSELLLVGKINEEIRPFLKKYEGSYRQMEYVPMGEIHKVFSQGSVFVMPSLEEGLALVIPQAMACGLPIVATTNTGAEDIVRDGTDGFIIPIRDVEALKEKIVYLYEHPDIREKMGISARERVSEGFEWSDFGDKIVAEFERILRER